MRGRENSLSTVIRLPGAWLVLLGFLGVFPRCATAADALPIPAIRNGDLTAFYSNVLQTVNLVEAKVVQLPANSFPGMSPDLDLTVLASTNVPVTFSNLSLVQITNKLQEIGYRVASQATNFPISLSSNYYPYWLVLRAKEVEVLPRVDKVYSWPDYVYPDFLWATNTHGFAQIQRAQISRTYSIGTNTNGGYKMLDGNTQESLPIGITDELVLPATNVRDFVADGGLSTVEFPMMALVDSRFPGTYMRTTAARAYTALPDGTVAEAGNVITDGTSLDPYATYGGGSSGNALNRHVVRGRLGIKLSLLTNGLPTVLALELTNGVTQHYLLPSGQPVDRPSLFPLRSMNGQSPIALVGEPGRAATVERTATLGLGANWITAASVLFPTNSGITTYTAPAVLGPGTPALFWRLRYD